MLHPSQPTRDPNFPAWLDIRPLHLANTASAAGADAHAQASAIGKYGIAGRVWEASAHLLAYLTRPTSANCASESNGEEGAESGSEALNGTTAPKYEPFDPPCSLFAPTSANPTTQRILELGSGQALASLHLAARLPARDTVVLTDLPNVVPLCQASIDTWARDGEGSEGEHARVIAQPLAWGESAAHLAPYGPFTHILMCDLVYFPHLYPPLLRTLLEITEPEETPSSDVFGPEIIIAWKSRSLSLEESFFDSFARYFHMEPVTGGPPALDVKLFLCRRWRVTDEWVLPEVGRVMAGTPGVVQGRSFGLAESLFAELEWD